MKRVRGFTLVEVMMVVVLIGIIAGAAFVFLRGGIRAADTASRSALESTGARLTLSGIESLMENAGYPGDLFRLENPVLEAGEETFTFSSNVENPAEFGPEDQITLTSADGWITAVDGNGDQLMASFEGAISFSYTDGAGAPTTDPGQVRSVFYTIESQNGAVYNGSTTPFNLQLAGLSPVEYRDLYMESDGHPGKWIDYIFEEDFEVKPAYVYEDYMEGGYVWEPILGEDFESAASWANNWVTWLSDAGYGRIERVNNASLSYEGSNSIVLDCWRSGQSTQLGVWNVDLDDYSDTDLRLRFYWREGSDELEYEDGVFLPVFTAGDTTVVDEEDFSGFRAGDSRDWTYWTNDYGRIEVTSQYPVDGNYLNMDSRRNGGANECRVMNTYDLSAFEGSSEVWLRFDFCSRGDETNDGDFVGLMDGSVMGTPVAQTALSPGTYPSGSWVTREVDLDELAPAGYDWSNFSIVFAQEDNDPTTSATGQDGISIDNVTIVGEQADYWDLSNRMIQAPSSFPVWEEAIVDLTAEAASAGIPISDDFNIGFAASTHEPYDVDGILYDAIVIEARNFGMNGWTHGVWPGYTEDEWTAVDNASDAHTGDWYYAVGGTGNYNTTPTQAWLQSPEIDLTSFSVGERVAVAFFHKYDFGGAGGGCNVKISADNGATWHLIVPYFGYYTSDVPALGNETGWTGQNYGWGSTGANSYDFCVFDITEYAGETVRLRFNYGTFGESHGGWQVDYCRSRAGADWPQVALGGSNFDWYAYSTSGSPDPSSTPDGAQWAGNDMSLAGGMDRMYEPNQNNFLLSPPIDFGNDSGDLCYSYVEFIACPQTQSGDTFLLECAAFGEVSPPSWHKLIEAEGINSSFQTFRYRVDKLPAGLVWGTNQTIVFRWRMLADGNSTTHGGWNLDKIQMYTTDVYQDNLFNGSVPVDGQVDYGDLRIVPYTHEPISTQRPRIRPLYSPHPLRQLEDNQ